MRAGRGSTLCFSPGNNGAKVRGFRLRGVRQTDLSARNRDGVGQAVVGMVLVGEEIDGAKAA